MTSVQSGRIIRIDICKYIQNQLRSYKHHMHWCTRISKNLSHVKELVILFLENVRRDKEISLNLSLISSFSNASKI